MKTWLALVSVVPMLMAWSVPAAAASLAGTPAAAPSPAKGETYYAVRLVDLDKTETVKVMSAADYTAEEKAIATEAKFLFKAQSEVARAWATNKETANIRFPIASLAPRRMAKLGTYNDAGKAEDKIKAYEDQQKKNADQAAKNKNQKAGKASAKETSKEQHYREALDLIQTRVKELIEAETAKPAEPAKPGGS